MATALAALVLVVQNQVPLRSAPAESAATQAVLWQGDALEVRGRRAGYLQVYDHRRERAGYVRTTQVRDIGAESRDAPALLAVVRFLRETPGSEALGIGYAAAYLKAAPAEALTAEPFEAVGVMAERLARRATVPATGGAATLAAHLEVVAQYGVSLRSFERNGTTQVCYDGEMFRRVLAWPTATADQRATAALGLTRHECVAPDLSVRARYEQDRWRAEVLDAVSASGVSEPLASRVRLRRAGVLATLAYEQTRHGEQATAAAARALTELLGANRQELADEDLNDYADAAVRVGASRLAAEPAAPRTGRLALSQVVRAPGETCVRLQFAGKEGAPLVERCTFGVVWAASAVANPAGTALALAVQPLDGWRELWVFRQTTEGWQVEVLPPATSDPELGYVEFAGWVPGADRLLVVRDVRLASGFRRRFEVLNLTTLAVEHYAPSPDLLVAFRWQDPQWKRGTVATR